MANIATLAVSITANTDKFVKGMQTGALELGSFAAKIGAFATAASALAATGLAALTRNSMEAIDITAKLADRLGVSTENMVAYQHAASLAGVSNEELTIGLEKFIKALPTGSNVGASFENVAKQIAAIKDPVQQAQAAVEVFGKSGQRLLPLLSTNLDEVRAMVEKNGQAFSRLDAAKVEAANDAWTNLKGALTGVGNQLAIAIAPMLQLAADRLREFISGGDGIRARVGNALEFIALGIAKVTDLTGLLEAAWYTLQSGFTTVVQLMLLELKQTANALDFVLEKMGLAKTGAAAFFNELDRGLGQDAFEAAKKANEAYTRFASGENEAKVRNFFGTVSREADAAAKKIADAAQAKLENNKQVVGLEDLLGVKGVASTDLFGNLGKGLDKFVKDFKDKTQDAVKALQDKAKEVFDATRTPAEAFLIQLQEIGKNPFIQGDLLTRALEDAKKKFEEASTPNLQAAGLGRSIDLGKIALGTQGTIKEQTVRDPRQERLAEEANALLKQMLSKIGNKPGVGE